MVRHQSSSAHPRFRSPQGLGVARVEAAAQARQEPGEQPRHVHLADPEGVACPRLRHLLTNRICSRHRSRWSRPAVTGRRARRSPRLRRRGRWHEDVRYRPVVLVVGIEGAVQRRRGATADGHTPEEGLRQLPGLPRPDLLRLLQRAQPVPGGAREVRLRCGALRIGRTNGDMPSPFGAALLADAFGVPRAARPNRASGAMVGHVYRTRRLQCEQPAGAQFPHDEGQHVTLVQPPLPPRFRAG